MITHINTPMLMQCNVNYRNLNVSTLMEGKTRIWTLLWSKNGSIVERIEWQWTGFIHNWVWDQMGSFMDMKGDIDSSFYSFSLVESEVSMLFISRLYCSLA